MFDLYENIKLLCEKRGYSVSAVCEAVGISKSTLSNLRNHRSTSISRKTAEKIAAYLEVSAEDVLYGPQAPAEDGELWEYLQMLKDNPGLKVLLDHSKHASREDIEAIVRVLGLGGKNEN